MPADDRLRDMFERLGAPEPSSDQREAARSNLHAAMRGEAAPRVSWWQRASYRWSAAAVVAAAVVAFVLFIPSSTREVDANLANIAAVARTVPPQELPDGAYVYYRIETTVLDENEPAAGTRIFYLLPTVEEIWVRGPSELRRTSVDTPAFFSDDDERTFYASDLPDSLGIGKTTELSLTEIPNDESLVGLSPSPDELWQQLIQRLSADEEFTTDDEARILDQLLEWLGPRLNAPPELRAAMIELIGRLDVSTSVTDSGSVVVVQRYRDDFGEFERRVTIDREGFLLREEQILRSSSVDPDFPTGLWADIVYSRPSTASEPGEVPGR